MSKAVSYFYKMIKNKMSTEYLLVSDALCKLLYPQDIPIT